jgi:hypothetical protein
MFGQWPLSKPGASSRRAFSTFRTKRLFSVSSVKARHGTAKSFSLISKGLVSSDSRSVGTRGPALGPRKVG